VKRAIRSNQTRILRARITKTVLAVLAVTAALATNVVAVARAGLLQPGRGKIFFGLTDSGVAGQFTEFTEAVGKHPAVIETFRSWGGDLRGSIKRWETAVARPMLHITTADPNDGHQIVSPHGIALGKGDHYLLNLNHYFWAHKMRAYLRPLGEPNRCLNPYAAYECDGAPRPGYDSPRWYKQAFRRMYIILHGGGKVSRIDARLARIGLPPLKNGPNGVLPGGLPRAPVAVVWSPLPAGSPEIKKNLPRHFYPGSRFVDWIGTDFYSDYPDWKSLSSIYSLARHKPFTLTEWGLNGSDDSRFVKRLFAWVQHHSRCRMLVYYQDFGSSSPYRLENYPASLAVVRRRLSSNAFPEYAFEPPTLPPPPPGGVSP
jgi:hypothetical protein